ncbi:gustatory and odorant receptor 24 [Agrilus planipennis]|uniref:Gustatory receptor n=1 Tax=Agrilus planipennis TaxID=224129 RepID=A0A1W4X3U4_AGRPL|nr:gustatory and odorant receptor 24 [Agrilus planipennis]
MANGEFRFSKFIFAYSVLIFAMLSTITAYLVFSNVKIKKTEGRFEDVVIEYLFQFYLTPIITFPLHWVESAKMAEIFSKWYLFEDLYRKIIGNKILIRKKRKYTIVTIGLWLMSSGMMFALYITLAEFEALKVIPYCFFNVTIYIFGGFWCIYMDAIRCVATQLEKDFRRSLRNIGPSYIPAELKILYMSLNELLQDFSSALSYSLIFLFLFLFVTVILSIYGLVSQLSQGITWKDVPHAVTAIMALAVLYISCEAAEKTTTSLKRNFQKPLLLLDTTWMRHETKKEITSFLRATLMNNSDVNISGFFTVNRGMFGALMSTMATYLIVLLQFQIILPEEMEEENIVNNSTSYNDYLPTEVTDYGYTFNI